MPATLGYIIEFVADMDRAVKFYRDVIGLPLKFQSPGWSEFATGATTLALHPASDKNPAGKTELGFTVPDLQQFYAQMSGKGVQFPIAPVQQDFGGMLAQFIDSEGAPVSVSGNATVSAANLSEDLDACGVQVDAPTADADLPAAEGGVA